MDLLERIALMSDDEAIRLAQRFAQLKLDETAALLRNLAPELRETLLGQLQQPSEPGLSPRDGVVARQALVLLAKDQPDDLQHTLGTPATEGAIAALALVTVALVVLQTEIKITKAAGGGWTLEFHKRPASDGLLQAFLKSICHFGLLAH